MTLLLDTSVLVRHLTEDPPDAAARARALLTGEEPLVVTDLVAAETLWVLESRYGVPPAVAAAAVRSVVATRSIRRDGDSVLLRILDLHERGASVVDAHLVARAERDGLPVATFDRGLGRGTTARTIEP